MSRVFLFACRYFSHYFFVCVCCSLVVGVLVVFACLLQHESEPRPRHAERGVPFLALSLAVFVLQRLPEPCIAVWSVDRLRFTHSGLR